MFLFIFESIGTSELFLIGILALIFLGPRRMPEMARKIGKILAEFRGTANEFKATWQREVNFEEEAKMLDPDAIEAETGVSRDQSIATTEKVETAFPRIEEVDPAKFEELTKPKKPKRKKAAPKNGDAAKPSDDKQNWL